MNHRSLALATLTSLVALTGCASGPRYCPQCGADLQHAGEEPVVRSAAAPAATPTVYRIAPARLAEEAAKALAAEPLKLPIESSAAGVIQTGWKDYEGEFHIARRWQERSRFRVVVIPDVSDPLNAARLEVSEETQRRSNDRAQWEPAGSRTGRARQIADAIAASLKK